MSPSSSSRLDQERHDFQQQIANLDINLDDDPLDTYYRYVQWLNRNYPQQQAVESGLVDLLEEATKKFLEDDHYKTDLRYLKLWIMYARYVQDPASVYSHCLSKNIGATYAVLYEEYADLLEKNGSLHQAEELYRRGIHRRARPADRLKAKYEQFQTRNPLKDAPNPGHNRYAPMLARPAPGKRPEKLRLDLSLIFTREGVEYSIQEARARSMGLLGKKWPPPAPTELDLERSAKARGAFADEGAIMTFLPGGKNIVPLAEPTVTLATKEALADVFGMYNSPEKSTRHGIVPGSKHAPVHTVKIIPRLPFNQSHVRELNNENSNAPAKGQTFTPYVDEDLRQDVKPTPKFQPYVDPALEEPPKPIPKFQPFVDFDLQQHPKQTPKAPQTARHVLAAKEVSPPSPPSRSLPDENAGARPSSRGAASSSIENKPGTVFSKVFTPAPARKDNPQKPHPFRPVPGAPKNPTFTPLREMKQLSSFKVFSRPTEQDGNIPMVSKSTFRPFVDSASRSENSGVVRASSKCAFSEVPSFSPDLEEQDDEYDDDGQFGTVDDEENQSDVQPKTPGAENDDDNAGVSYRSRFGRAGIDIMTPISERTFEVTTTGTLPSGPIFKIQDATEVAKQLAAELREEEREEVTQEHSRYEPISSSEYVVDDEDGDDDEDETHFTTDDPIVQDVDTRTGTLSLIDAMTVASSFRPPNPCNPFEPSITSTLLSLSLAHSTFHDYRNENANQLALLQKFCIKQNRRGSNTSSKSFDHFTLTLGGRLYEIIGKLGEGGFGAVFSARDVLLSEEDYDAMAMIAIKVVKPSNIWEFHILQNLRSSLPSDLRSSIIEPHALFAFHDESFLTLDMCVHGTLLELVNRVHEINVGQKGACLNELLVIFFTIELLRIVEGMHVRGFIHGDLKIDNCLLRLEDIPSGGSTWSSTYQPNGSGGWSYKGLRLIDFGRTIDTRQFPKKNQQFIADWPTDARDCREMREGKPWSFQPDYFGLAGIVYCMLWGKYLDEGSVVQNGEGRFKPSVSFKRYWQVEMWTELFDLLLNPTLVRPDGQLPLCTEMGLIRRKFEEWLEHNDRSKSSSLQGLLKKVAIASLRDA